MNKLLICFTSFNRQPFTQISLKSLFDNTKIPFDLVVIDNGSEKIVKDWLIDNLENKTFENGTKIKLILNEENKGIEFALYQAQQLLENGQHFMKLDNDVQFLDNNNIEESLYLVEKYNLGCTSHYAANSGTDEYLLKDNYCKKITIKSKNYYVVNPPHRILSPAAIYNKYIAKDIDYASVKDKMYAQDGSCYVGSMACINKGFQMIYHSIGSVNFLDKILYDQCPEIETYQKWKEDQLKGINKPLKFDKVGFNNLNIF